jgi:hypothetical protein
MIGIVSLWLPIVLSAVIMFVVSSILHMVVGHHKNDYVEVPDETGVMAAIGKAGARPGQYRFPYVSSMKDMGSPETKEKFERGPVGLLTILPSGPPSMGASLVQWFVYALVAGVFVAYVASRTLEADTDYLQVFRVTGTVAFFIYAGALPLESIWKGQKWSTTLKYGVDALIYGVLTGGVFGWLWP